MISVPEPGTILAGKYRVEGLLGQGGMGMVLRAHDLPLDRAVALKLLTTPRLTPQDIQRFMREGRAAARLESAHVAQVYEVGSLSEGTPYLAMEFLVGSDLSQRLEQHGALTPDEAARYVVQACDAIGEAHSVGIVHRDLKPANLFLTRRRDGSTRVKVLDFGISKLEDATNQSLTQTTTMMGSPYYMSPEQVRSAKHVGPAADIWSLGVILYELVTSHPPFEGETLPALSVAIVTDPTPSLRALRPDAPAALEAIVNRCLEKDPARRFSSIGELVSALAPIAGEVSRQGSLPGAESSGSHVGASAVARALSNDTLQPIPTMVSGADMARRPWVLGAVAVVAVLGLGAGAMALRSPGTESPSSGGTAASSAPTTTVATTTVPVVTTTSAPVASVASAAPVETSAPTAASGTGKTAGGKTPGGKTVPGTKGRPDVGKAIKTID